MFAFKGDLPAIWETGEQLTNITFFILFKTKTANKVNETKR